MREGKGRGAGAGSPPCSASPEETPRPRPPLPLPPPAPPLRGWRAGGHRGSEAPTPSTPEGEREGPRLTAGDAARRPLSCLPRLGLRLRSASRWPLRAPLTPPPPRHHCSSPTLSATPAPSHLLSRRLPRCLGTGLGYQSLRGLSGTGGSSQGGRHPPNSWATLQDSGHTVPGAPSSGRPQATEGRWRCQQGTRRG